MPIPSSGPISFLDINAQIGNGSNPMSLAWVRDNTYFAKKDLASIRGYSWYAAQWSHGLSVRNDSAVTPNCATQCQCSQANPSAFNAALKNCTYTRPSNCNQCTAERAYLQPNCNCNCNCANCQQNYNNCNCNCDCDCRCSDCNDTCFVAGSLVLLHGGTWKPIEQVTECDVLMGIDGQPAEVIGIIRTTLGDRQLITIDGRVYFSSEHPIWTKTGPWTYDRARWEREVADGVFPGVLPGTELRQSRGVYERFAHIEGWVDAIPEVIPSRPTLPLYMPLTRGVPVIVNGFVVSAGDDEAAFVERFGHRYAGFDWDALRPKIGV